VAGVQKSLEEIYIETEREYYTGNNVDIFFNNIYVDECTSVGFRSVINNSPAYPYNSELFNSITKGNYRVEGKFTVNFVSNGYIEHIIQKGEEAKLNGTFSPLGRLSGLDTGQATSSTGGVMNLNDPEFINTSIFDPRSTRLSDSERETARAKLRDYIWGYLQVKDKAIIESLRDILAGTYFDILIMMGNPNTDSYDVKNLVDCQILDVSMELVKNMPLQLKYTFIARDMDRPSSRPNPFDYIQNSVPSARSLNLGPFAMMNYIIDLTEKYTRANIVDYHLFNRGHHSNIKDYISKLKDNEVFKYGPGDLGKNSNYNRGELNHILKFTKRPKGNNTSLKFRDASDNFLDNINIMEVHAPTSIAALLSHPENMTGAISNKFTGKAVSVEFEEVAKGGISLPAPDINSGQEHIIGRVLETHQHYDVNDNVAAKKDIENEANAIVAKDTNKSNILTGDIQSELYNIVSIVPGITGGLHINQSEDAGGSFVDEIWSKNVPTIKNNKIANNEDVENFNDIVEQSVFNPEQILVSKGDDSSYKDTATNDYDVKNQNLAQLKLNTIEDEDLFKINGNIITPDPCVERRTLDDENDDDNQKNGYQTSIYSKRLNKVITEYDKFDYTIQNNENKLLSVINSPSSKNFNIKVIEMNEAFTGKKDKAMLIHLHDFDSKTSDYVSQLEDEIDNGDFFDIAFKSITFNDTINLPNNKEGGDSGDIIEETISDLKLYYNEFNTSSLSGSATDPTNNKFDVSKIFKDRSNFSDNIGSLENIEINSCKDANNEQWNSADAIIDGDIVQFRLGGNKQDRNGILTINTTIQYKKKETTGKDNVAIKADHGSNGSTKIDEYVAAYIKDRYDILKNAFKYFGRLMISRNSVHICIYCPSEDIKYNDTYTLRGYYHLKDNKEIYKTWYNFDKFLTNIIDNGPDFNAGNLASDVSNLNSEYLDYNLFNTNFNNEDANSSISIELIRRFNINDVIDKAFYSNTSIESSADFSTQRAFAGNILQFNPLSWTSDYDFGLNELKWGDDPDDEEWIGYAYSIMQRPTPRWIPCKVNDKDYFIIPIENDCLKDKIPTNVLTYADFSFPDNNDNDLVHYAPSDKSDPDNITQELNSYIGTVLPDISRKDNKRHFFILEAPYSNGDNDSTYKVTDIEIANWDETLDIIKTGDTLSDDESMKELTRYIRTTLIGTDLGFYYDNSDYTKGLNIYYNPYGQTTYYKDSKNNNSFLGLYEKLDLNQTLTQCNVLPIESSKTSLNNKIYPSIQPLERYYSTVKFNHVGLCSGGNDTEVYTNLHASELDESHTDYNPTDKWDYTWKIFQFETTKYSEDKNHKLPTENTNIPELDNEPVVVFVCFGRKSYFLLHTDKDSGKPENTDLAGIIENEQSKNAKIVVIPSWENNKSPQEIATAVKDAINNTDKWSDDRISIDTSYKELSSDPTEDNGKGHDISKYVTATIDSKDSTKVRLICNFPGKPKTNPSHSANDVRNTEKQGFTTTTLDNLRDKDLIESNADVNLFEQNGPYGKTYWDPDSLYSTDPQKTTISKRNSLAADGTLSLFFSETDSLPHSVDGIHLKDCTAKFKNPIANTESTINDLNIGLLYENLWDPLLFILQSTKKSTDDTPETNIINIKGNNQPYITYNHERNNDNSYTYKHTLFSVNKLFLTDIKTEQLQLAMFEEHSADIKHAHNITPYYKPSNNELEESNNIKDTDTVRSECYKSFIPFSTKYMLANNIIKYYSMKTKDRLKMPLYKSLMDYPIFTPFTDGNIKNGILGKLNVENEDIQNVAKIGTLNGLSICLNRLMTINKSMFDNVNKRINYGTGDTGNNTNPVPEYKFIGYKGSGCAFPKDISNSLVDGWQGADYNVTSENDVYYNQYSPATIVYRTSDNKSPNEMAILHNHSDSLNPVDHSNEITLYFEFYPDFKTTDNNPDNKLIDEDTDRSKLILIHSFDGTDYLDILYELMLRTMDDTNKIKYYIYTGFVNIIFNNLKEKFSNELKKLNSSNTEIKLLIAQVIHDTIVEEMNSMQPFGESKIDRSRRFSTKVRGTAGFNREYRPKVDGSTKDAFVRDYVNTKMDAKRLLVTGTDISNNKKVDKYLKSKDNWSAYIQGVKSHENTKFDVNTLTVNTERALQNSTEPIGVVFMVQQPPAALFRDIFEICGNSRNMDMWSTSSGDFFSPTSVKYIDFKVIKKTDDMKASISRSKSTLYWDYDNNGEADVPVVYSDKALLSIRDQFRSSIYKHYRFKLSMFYGAGIAPTEYEALFEDIYNVFTTSKISSREEDNFVPKVTKGEAKPITDSDFTEGTGLTTGQNTTILRIKLYHKDYPNG